MARTPITANPTQDRFDAGADTGGIGDRLEGGGGEGVGDGLGPPTMRIRRRADGTISTPSVATARSEYTPETVDGGTRAVR